MRVCRGWIYAIEGGYIESITHHYDSIADPSGRGCRVEGLSLLLLLLLKIMAHLGTAEAALLVKLQSQTQGLDDLPVACHYVALISGRREWIIIDDCRLEIVGI